MSHISPNTVRFPVASKPIDLAFMRPLQKQFLHDRLFLSIDESVKLNDHRITIIPAGTGSGKSTVVTKITIPTIISRDPNVNCIVFTSPDSGCVDGPFSLFSNEWNGRKITCTDGTVKEIRARRKDDITKSWAVGEQTPNHIVDVWFVTTQWLGFTWKDYRNPNILQKSIGVPQYIIVDEIHFGMGTINSTTVFEDQGRRNKNIDPKWLPTIYGMACFGSRVIGYTGTATVSQRGGTTLGATVFKTLARMPESKNTSVFAESMPIETDINSAYISQDVALTYELSKLQYELTVSKTLQFFKDIDQDTWDKAKVIGIEKLMPGAFFKFGRCDAATSIPLEHDSYCRVRKGKKKDFLDYSVSIGSDCGIVTSDQKTIHPKGGGAFVYPSANDVITRVNDKSIAHQPLTLGVIMQGNMGWDIPRLKQVSFLGHPSAKNVHLMQLQTMARAKRLVHGVYDHTAKAIEIAELDVSSVQKELLARYVVFSNTVNIVVPKYAHLLKAAYSEFKQHMHTPAEGLDLYLNTIKNHVPAKSNVKKITKPHFHMGYNPGSQNQANKKDYCQHCTDLGLVNDKGITLCEVIGRIQAEDIAGRKLDDAEFKEYWKGQLKVDHLNGVRTDNRPENLYTRDGISDGLKTLINKDYLNSYKKA